MSFTEKADGIIKEFKADPRNKVFVDFQTLLLAATEETGSTVTEDDLKSAIQAFIDGSLEDEQQSIYDGATYACGHIARSCFSDDPDTDIDYEIDWNENADGTFAAEVRPS